MVWQLINSAGRLLQTLVILLFPMVTPVLRPNDPYQSRYRAAINRVVQPVMHRVFELLRPQNLKTIKELLFEIPDYSNKKYRKNFNDPERRKLDNNEPSTGFDITFLYKLIQFKPICELADTNEDKWSELGTLENSLKRIKDCRNVISHTDISITYDELRESIRNLENLCRSVLLGVGLKRKTNVFSDIAEMEKGMDEVLVGANDMNYPKQTQNSVLLREGRKDITKLAKNLRILNPFAWLHDSNYSHLDIEHIFTELEISDGSGKVEIPKLLTTRLSKNDLPEAIVVSGPPGIGKTSLFRFLVNDWLLSNPSVLGMENVDLVIPLELRHVFSKDLNGLIRNEILHSVSQHLEVDDILAALGNICLLWLLDGYDEAKWKTKEVIKEILQVFPNSRILITTRTECTSEIILCLNQIHRTHLGLVLKGFSTSNVENCSKNLICASLHAPDKRREALEEFKEFLHKENRSKWEIFKVPLFVTIIVVLWLDSPDKLCFVKTKSSLYSLLVDTIINKLMVREAYNRLNDAKLIRKKKINKFLDVLGKMLFRKDIEFSLKQYEVEYLMDFCNELEIPFTDTMSAFFVCSERSIGIEEEYTIIHRVLMEFLIARAFCNEMILKDWDVMKTAEDWFQTTRQVLLQFEPENQQLKTMFHLENLKRDLPNDIFQKYREERFVMCSESFFNGSEICGVCEKQVINPDYCEYFTSDNFWCHARDKTGGMRIAFLLGYLNIRKQLTKRRCEQLAFFYFRFSGTGYGDFQLWKILLEEAENDVFNKELFKYIARFTWSFPGEDIDGVQELLSVVVPNSVFLHFCPGKYTENNVIVERNACEILLTQIRMFMAFCLDVHLDLTYFLSRPGSGKCFALTCIELLLKDISLCRLVTVRCPVNEEILNKLKNAVHLRELTVRLHGQDLNELAKLINNLPELKTLNLIIEPISYIGLQIPRLIPENRTISTDLIILVDVFNVKSKKLGLATKKLCPNPGKLVLHGAIKSIDKRKISSIICSVLENVGCRKLRFVFDISDNIFVIHCLDHLRDVRSAMERRFEFFSMEFCFTYGNGVFHIDFNSAGLQAKMKF